MEKLPLKEKIFYGLILNENRIYRHWYSRFLLCGVALDRMRRVAKRTKNWYAWCSEWHKEGQALEMLAEKALSQNNTNTAKELFREAAGCYHIGQHFFYIDPQQKNKSLERVWVNYRRALDLYDEHKKPVRLDIPFRNTHIPCYLRLQSTPKRPLIILINGMDNLKETEMHYQGELLADAGFNTLVFDGPGQGEMWKDMEFIPDFEKSVSAIIDWFEIQRKYDIDLKRIAAVGFSLGGYLAPLAAAHDKRICCAVGNGGPAAFKHLPSEKKIAPTLYRGFMHITKKGTYKEAMALLDFDIKKAPPMDRPLLIFHSGNDKLIPRGKKHGDYFMEWATGEKELKFYPDGEHVCANYLDEVFPYTVDWLKKQLDGVHASTKERNPRHEL
jgi:alpha-beta hydrolase superfamily lysophospholipase